MTDLEDLWESYPTSEPPTPELLREGRRQARARRRHRVLRPLLVGVTTAALAGAFLVGTHAGTDAGGDATVTAPDLRTSAFRADLHPATSCADLLSSYRARGRAAVTAYGWGFGWREGLYDGDLGFAARGVANLVYPASTAKSLDSEWQLAHRHERAGVRRRRARRGQDRRVSRRTRRRRHAERVRRLRRHHPAHGAARSPWTA